jgi:hypothetical protein
MDSVTNITMAHMNNETHVQFHESVRMLMERWGEKLTIPLFGQYDKSLNDEKEALLIIKKSEITADIADKDRSRDGVFRGFSDTVKGLRNHFDYDVRQLANRLWNVFLHYGNIARKPLDAQTAATEDMLREFEREDLKAAIAQLNLDDWRQKIDEENRAVQRLMMDRYAETAAQTTLRMKTTRVETDKFYRAIAADARNQVLAQNNAETWMEFIREINVIVKRYKDLQAQKFGRKNKE